jgi:hypothetical protein
LSVDSQEDEDPKKKDDKGRPKNLKVSVAGQSTERKPRQFEVSRSPTLTNSRTRGLKSEFALNPSNIGLPTKDEVE